MEQTDASNILLAKVQQAIPSLKNGKAAGQDGNIGEILK